MWPIPFVMGMSVLICGASCWKTSISSWHPLYSFLLRHFYQFSCIQSTLCPSVKLYSQSFSLLCCCVPTITIFITLITFLILLNLLSSLMHDCFFQSHSQHCFFPLIFMHLLIFFKLFYLFASFTTCTSRETLYVYYTIYILNILAW